MSNTVQIVYVGGLDEYHHDELDLHFFRGRPTDVPAEHAGRFLRAQRDKNLKLRPESRDFFRVDETIPERADEAYLAYPDRVIEAMKAHAKVYQRVHDLVDEDDQRKAEAMRKGAMDEVNYAESMIEEHKAMKAERLAKMDDLSPTVRGRKKAESVA